MNILNKLFGKSDSKQLSKVSSNRDDRARQLFETAMKLGFEDEDFKKRVAIGTEILEILDLMTTSLYLGVVYWQRAMAYKNLKNYDAALKDLEQALLFAQQKGDNGLILDCHKETEEIKQLNRNVDIEASGGNKANKLKAMEKQARDLIMQTGFPEADAIFQSLFADLKNSDADIRMNASRILAGDQGTLIKLRDIYKESLISDPIRAGIAGRVLGRKMAKGVVMRIATRNVQMMYGLNISFIPCLCAHCNVMNFGIPAPPRGGDVPYYHQVDNKGAYAVQVVCDQCSKEFFVVWDQDPT